MKKSALLFCTLLAVIGCMTSSSEGVSAGDRPTGFQWLGTLPADDNYSTKVMRLNGPHGAIIKDSVILVSNDGGRSWLRLRNAGSPIDVIYAWLTPSLQLLRLSDKDLLMSASPEEAGKQLKSQQPEISYLATAATENFKQILLVGGRSVRISSQRLEALPQYARDPTTESPRMIVPAISVSGDSGLTWEMTKLPNTVGYLDSVKIVGDDAIAWGPYAVYASTNAGKSWQIMKMNIPVDEEEAYPIAAAISGNQVLVSLKNGRLLIGELGDASLEPLAKLSNAIGQLTFTSSCVGFGVSLSTTAEEDALMKTENGGKTWAAIFLSKNIVALAASGSTLYGATRDHAFRLQPHNEFSGKTCVVRTEP